MGESVAVVIPVWKEDLTEFERISFIQACRILNKYKVILVTYHKLNLSYYIQIIQDESVEFEIKYFDKKYFESTESYNALMLSVSFYRRFLFYKFILVYQTDCFVFRDDLMSWLEEGVSYIGAPWLKGFSSAKNETEVIGVGNGGLSLRRVGHHIKALIIYNYMQKRHLLLHLLDDGENSMPLVSRVSGLLKKLFLQSAFQFNGWSANEDYFWGIETNKSSSWFKVPDWRLASRFSMEVQPAYFYHLNNNELPFGCHAWWRYDFEFWKPFIENFGYSLATSEIDK